MNIFYVNPYERDSVPANVRVQDKLTGKTRNNSTQKLKAKRLRTKKRRKSNTAARKARKRK